MIGPQSSTRIRETNSDMRSNAVQHHFSLYLDVARFGAAVLVVLSHFLHQDILAPTIASLVPDLGREAVMVFFVLSGYVIAYSAQNKTRSLRDYALARCARIYSVALPLLLMAFIGGAVTLRYAPDGVPHAYQVEKANIYLPLHLLFLGELWNLAETPPWMTPYWSLNYEVWYYVLFAVLFYLSGYKRVLLGAGVLLILGHKLWLLLPVWYSGVYLLRYQKHHSISTAGARVGWVATLGLLVLYKYLDADVDLRALGADIWPFSNLHLGIGDRYLADYFVCALIWVNFYFALNARFSALVAFDTVIRCLASYTFTLYLIHGFVIAGWLAAYPRHSASALDIILLSSSIALVTYVAAAITEHQRARVAAVFSRVFGLASAQLRLRGSS